MVLSVQYYIRNYTKYVICDADMVFLQRLDGHNATLDAAFEVVPLCGCKGVTPVAQFLAQVKEDFADHHFFPGRESEISYIVGSLNYQLCFFFWWDFNLMQYVVMVILRDLLFGNIMIPCQKLHLMEGKENSHLIEIKDYPGFKKVLYFPCLNFKSWHCRVEQQFSFSFFEI